MHHASPQCSRTAMLGAHPECAATGPLWGSQVVVGDGWTYLDHVTTALYQHRGMLGGAELLRCGYLITF